MDKRRKKFKKGDVMKAIKGSSGLLKNVAKELHCSVANVRDIINKDMDLQDAMAREIAIMEDLAKDTIQQALLDGDLGTARWYLEYQAKKGYQSEAQKIVISFVEDI